MRSARDQSPSLPIDVLGISLQRVPHVEAWRVGCHLSSPPRHSTGVPNDTKYLADVSTLHDYSEQWSRDGNALRRPGSGWSHGAIEREDRRVRSTAMAHRTASVAEFEQQLEPQ
ncbi:hypothetical protein TNCV_1153251 [Trichonephila clavipes]|nr:hypothetical protein TNCV_1153251 [Trichonephila clavipes]